MPPETDDEIEKGEEAAKPEPVVELPAKVELVGAKGPVLKARFIVPASLAERFELLYAANEERAYAAALFRCCGPLRKKVAAKDNIPDLGKAVLDYLLGEGVPWFEILTAGRTAWMHCIRDLPDLEAARSAAGFSAPGSGDSTS